MKHWKPVSITAAAAILSATLGTGLSAVAATPESTVRASRTALSVSVTGPQTVTVGTSCTWEAHVSGGTAPYTYYWVTMYTPYTQGSTDPTFSTSFDKVGPDLVDVLVEDAYGNRVRAGRGVYVTDDHRNC